MKQDIALPPLLLYLYCCLYNAVRLKSRLDILQNNMNIDVFEVFGRLRIADSHMCTQLGFQIHTYCTGKEHQPNQPEGWPWKFLPITIA